MRFFKKLTSSITDVRQYPAMVKEGLGKTFVYLLFLTLTVGLLNSIIIGVQFNRYSNHYIKDIMYQMPKFTFQNGTLNVDGKMPAIIHTPDNETIIIDTTGKANETVLKKYNSGVLILKNQVIIKNNNVETRTFSFANIKDLTFTNSDVINFLPKLKWISTAVGIFILFFFFIGKMVTSLFLAIIALIITKMQRVQLSFGKLYSIGIYSLTLPILLNTIFRLFQMTFPSYLYYVIAIVYGVLAVGQMKKANEKIEE